VWHHRAAVRLHGPSADLEKEIDALLEAGADIDGPRTSWPGRQQPAQTAARPIPRRTCLKKLATLQKEGRPADRHADEHPPARAGRTLEIRDDGPGGAAWTKGNRPQDFHVNLTPGSVDRQQRGGYGGFGSTQSTILALKALLAYTKKNARHMEPGS